ncbi:50S ribosomal protein L7 serine acetyltransferase [Adhaeribacter aerolatus]|uniref:50S ribosomal protein L7 serine acetyltransferase n=1 Tax=Adhaeribacter aerolatus TaxID=670289 RepID=A0A512ARM8_9BACT|nr:GNAT family protein [Adhaeribacter aerolatus]GEO02374.1 50S ribosomal protein L7 serine acetyltransferase [Adhaeribacter aerolatus]
MAEIAVETELITERLRLRTYQEADAEAFLTLIQENKTRLAPSFPSRVRVTNRSEEALRLIKRFRVDWQLGQVYAFGIWRKEQNVYIGDISLKNFDNSIPKAEVGYYLAAASEGRGYCTEALRAVTNFAFEQLDVNKLYIRCSLGNNRSYALAERCGYQREGLVRHDFRDHTRQLIDVYYYGITRPDYRAFYQN